MRHKVAGWKLGRNTAHRRSLLRNLVTSLIMEERIETTILKAKAMRPNVEKMITLGKRGDLSARRQAASYLMTGEAVTSFSTPSLRASATARRVSPHYSLGLEKGRRRGNGFHRTSRQRKDAGREAAEARGSSRQACRRNQEGDGRGRSGTSSARRGTGVGRRQGRVGSGRVRCNFQTHSYGVRFLLPNPDGSR